MYINFLKTLMENLVRMSPVIPVILSRVKISVIGKEVNDGFHMGNLFGKRVNWANVFKDYLNSGFDKCSIIFIIVCEILYEFYLLET